MITLGSKNQGTKFYRIEKGKVQSIQEPAFRVREVVVITTQGKHSSGIAVFTKAEKCYKTCGSIERSMDRTDSFKWEDLPTGYGASGHYSVAGWIPRINVFSLGVDILIFL